MVDLRIERRIAYPALTGSHGAGGHVSFRGVGTAHAATETRVHGQRRVSEIMFETQQPTEIVLGEFFVLPARHDARIALVGGTF